LGRGIKGRVIDAILVFTFVPVIIATWTGSSPIWLALPLGSNPHERRLVRVFQGPPAQA
jgi:hypothetical protein